MGGESFLLSAAGSIQDTRTPGPPLPSDNGSWDSVGGACQSLAAAARVWTGWVCYFLLTDLRGDWGRENTNYLSLKYTPTVHVAAQRNRHDGMTAALQSS